MRVVPNVRCLPLARSPLAGHALLKPSSGEVRLLSLLVAQPWPTVLGRRSEYWQQRLDLLESTALTSLFRPMFLLKPIRPLTMAGLC